MTNETGESDVNPTAQFILARRLNLLLEVVVAERGTPMTFLELQQKLANRGVALSRGRWQYMKDGTERLVSDPKLLTAISEIFGVDPAYLLGDENSGLPDQIDSRLEFLKALKAAQVKSFAARALGEISPDALRAITEFLNNDIKLHQGNTQGDAIDPEDSGDGRPSAL